MSISEFDYAVAQRRFTGLCAINENAPTVVCLHGFLDNAASFVPLMPFLDKFNVIALDHAGHGKAPHRPPHQTYHLTDYAFDVAVFVQDYLRRKQQQKVFIVGHSLGGIVGSIFTSCFAELVSAFVSIEACGPLSESEDSTTKQLRASFDSRIEAERAPSKETRTLQDLIRARAKISDVSLSAAKLLIQRNCTETSSGIQWISDRRLRTKSPIRMTEAQACNVLASITVPMCLILGNHGFEKIKRNLTNRIEYMHTLADVREVEGGHHLHMQSPELVARAITDFFEHPSEPAITLK